MSKFLFGKWSKLVINLVAIIVLCLLAVKSYLNYGLSGVMSVMISITIFLFITALMYFTGDSTTKRVIRRCFTWK